jgi:hypothetical protein
MGRKPSGYPIQRMAQHLELMKVSGLEKVLPFACPPETSSESPNVGGGARHNSSDDANYSANNGAQIHHHQFQQHRLMKIEEYRNTERNFKKPEYHESLRPEIAMESQRASSSISNLRTGE